MRGYVVYADILLALNFVLDLFLLWAGGSFARREILFRRLIPAAALGAAYGSAMVLPVGQWLYSVPVAVIVSLIMLAIAYPWRGWGAFLRLGVIFYLSAFAMAGAALAGAYLLNRGGYTLDGPQVVKAGALLFSLFLAIILARRGAAMIRRNWRKEEFRVEVEISISGRTARLRGLVDTGNDLHEPISGLPVLVADYRTLRPLFSSRFQDVYERCQGDPVNMMKRLNSGGDVWWGKRLRLVPFSSIGKNHGMMAGFRPDKLTVIQAGHNHSGDAIVCIAVGGLSGSGEFQAVLNPEVIQGYDDIREVGA